MEDGPSGGPRQPIDEGPPPLASGPVGPAPGPDPLAAEAAELRRLVDAGAGTPEELRALAARLREHRQREEAAWRSAVKPHLVKQGRGRLRRPPSTPPPPPLPALGDPIPPPPGVAVEGSPDPTVPTVPPALGLPASWGVGEGGPPVAPASGSRALWLGVGLLAMVAVAVLAARTTVWVLVLPVVALLGWAWAQGRDAAP